MAAGAGRNTLAEARSPYLLQHRDNPVHWREWGEEAFQLAQRLQRPIFLSSGYSSCRWCHVMARESFESEEIAQLLNDKFVSIKLDREERPDIDSVYMTYLQATNEGRGGWPMSVFLLPPAPAAGDLDGDNDDDDDVVVVVGGKEPFFAGTYFPPAQFAALLQSLSHAWETRPGDVRGAGAAAMKALQRMQSENEKQNLDGHDEGEPGDGKILRSAAQLKPMFLDHLRRSFDRDWGGFGRAPKFPTPSQLLPLIAQAQELPRDERQGQLERFFPTDSAAAGPTSSALYVPPAPNPPGALFMLLTTMRAFWCGGMFDHVEGGFARYSVDKYWHIPHFEKMLYDQGQILELLADSFQLAGGRDVALRKAAEDTCAYLLRVMCDAETGLFFSAEDAESTIPGMPAGDHHHMGEGAFYLWSDKECREVLAGEATGGEQAASRGEAEQPSLRYRAFALRFGFEAHGNIRAQESDPHGEMENMNHPFVARSFEDVVEQLASASPPVQLTTAEAERLCDEALARLFEARSARRERPGLDDKVLTAWNGLAITGLSRCGAVMDRPKWVSAAARAADSLRQNLFDPETGSLTRVWRQGSRGEQAMAFADDYAFLVQGLLDLYSATLDAKFLLWADQLQLKMNDDFFSPAAGGWYSTAAGQGDVLVRSREEHDGAEPSASSVALRNCERLSRILGDDSGRLASVIRSVRRWALSEESPFARTSGAVAPCLLRALYATESPHRSLVLVGERTSESVRAMLRCYHQVNDQFLSLILLDPSAPDDMQNIVRGREWLTDMAASNNKSPSECKAFFCEGMTCQAPTTSADTLRQLISGP